MAVKAKRRGLSIFTREKPVTPEMPARDPAEANAVRIAAGVPEGYFRIGGAAAGMLFMDPDGSDEERFTLSWVRMAPGYIIPRHSHTSACLYYVTEGELHLGKQVVGAGGGFFVPFDAPYTYQAGPDGAEVLEFRATTSGMVTHWSESPEGWERVVANGEAHRDEWIAAGFGPGTGG